ncbi:hypothetical protein [Variovorax sp. EBFNA2]|uniref:hypothetical protein n=1 Tax=Variovorax sp. EBFNA2 TaxID=3342097 RepID=UPI0029C0EFFB|nr:hypothetical protein [Variovorax boronicumulans]WPG36570.1 hypothetical protein RZE79_24255 [Variovorax boronicumulans]
MKKARSNNISRARLLAIVAAVAAISACGGGGDGGGAPAFPILPIAEPAPPPTPAPVSDSSGPCFNEADFREGTVVEFEAAKPGTDPATPSFRRKAVIEAREAFGGANPIAVNVGSETFKSPQFQQSTVKKEYKDLVNGSFLLYGKSTTYKNTIDPSMASSVPPGFPLENISTVSQTFTPPFAFPVNMAPGQVVSQQSTAAKTSVLNGQSGTTVSLPASGELTYHGREQLETPLGTFNTCKLSLKITVGAAGISKDITREFWLAAEGPYRGQLLKGGDTKTSMVVTKMTYVPK